MVKRGSLKRVAVAVGGAVSIGAVSIGAVSIGALSIGAMVILDDVSEETEGRESVI